MNGFKGMGVGVDEKMGSQLFVINIVYWFGWIY